MKWNLEDYYWNLEGKPQGKTDVKPQQLATRVGDWRRRGAFSSFRQALKWNTWPAKSHMEGRDIFGGRNRKFKMLRERIKLLRKAFSEET